MTETAALLHELDADEFFDVYRQFFPDATREDFDREWAEFQRLKALHAKQRSAQ